MGAGGNQRVRWAEADGVLTLTLDRPEKLNAVTEDMLEVLREAVAALAERDELRVLVITGEGRYLTAGADVTALPVGETGPGVRGSVFRRTYRRLHQLFDEIEAVEKPVVLAAQGPCLGIGVELACSCDLRVASTAARFGLPEVRTLAALPGSGGISRLVRLVGPHWTKWLAMAGRELDAEQALAAGFLHAVHPPETFAEAVRALAEDLVALPAEALGLAKIVIDTAAHTDRTGARHLDRIANSGLITAEEHLARIEAFRTRRR